MAVDVGGRGSVQGLRPAKPKKTSTGNSLGKVVAKTSKKVARKASSSSSRRSSGGSSRSSGSSSGSSSRRSSGSSGRNYNPPAPKPRPAPKPPSLADYLGTDSVYQQAVRGGKRSLTDYLSELTRRRGEAGTQFEQTKASMERDRVQQLEALKDEFASRGLIQSGLYGEEQGRFQQQFTEQASALEQQQAALLADILGQQKNYQREYDLALEQAKQEAIMRRAQKYKIGA